MLLAALGMVLLPLSAQLGLVGLVSAIVLLHSGINLQRAPMQALIPDLVPSRHRSLAFVAHRASAAITVCSLATRR